MRYIILAILIVFTLTNCTDSEYGNNPYLPEVAVNLPIYFNNPDSQSLQFVGGYIEKPVGIKGIVVYRGASDIYYAFDLACPNHIPSECKKMSVDGLNMTCSCDDYKYALPLGGAPQNGGKYPAKEYRVINNGQSLLITNY